MSGYAANLNKLLTAIVSLGWLGGCIVILHLMLMGMDVVILTLYYLVYGPDDFDLKLKSFGIVVGGISFMFIGIPCIFAYGYSQLWKRWKMNSWLKVGKPITFACVIMLAVGTVLLLSGHIFDLDLFRDFKGAIFNDNDKVLDDYYYGWGEAAMIVFFMGVIVLVLQKSSWRTVSG